MGSSGGGGSTSGKTDFPDYMKKFHAQMLDDGDAATLGPDSLIISVTDAFNTAVSGSSPYSAYTTETEPVTNMFSTWGGVVPTTVFSLLKTYQDINFDTAYAAYATGNSTVAAMVADITTTLDDDINVNVLPKFKGNLRSIGAVMSSAYVVGEALIWDSKVKALAKERLNIEQTVLANKEFALKMTLSFIEFKKGLVQTTTDIIKYYYALKTELADHYSAMVAKDLRWDLEMFQYVNNTLSAISGAALSQGSADKSPSKVGSAIGGALSGAATGAMVGSVGGASFGPAGAAVGGALGLAGGLL